MENIVYMERHNSVVSNMMDLFSAVAKKSVNVVMITQGSSELNLAFVVRDSDARKAVNAVHNEFKLGN